MKQTQHTPGPWTTQIDGDKIEVLYFTPGKCADGIDEIGNRPIPATLANARLIAAAPELLEALEGIYNFPNQCSCEVSNECIKAFDKARAAIARVQGKERS